MISLNPESRAKSTLKKDREVSELGCSRATSTLAWKIPWTEEPGGLQSMGSLGVGHN